MKKTIFAITVLSLFVLYIFSSCKKPEYQPERKISKIYKSESFTSWADTNYRTIEWPKRIFERWSWDGDKLMQLYHNGRVLYFYYDKNRLDRIEFSSVVAQIEYDGEYVKKVVVKKHDELSYEVEILARNEHKITKIKYSYDYESYDDAKSLAALDTMIDVINGMFFSKSLTDIMSKNIATKKMKEGKAIKTYAQTIDYIYSGNNVTQLSSTIFYEGSIEKSDEFFEFDSLQYYLGISDTTEINSLQSGFVQGKIDISNISNTDQPIIVFITLKQNPDSSIANLSVVSKIIPANSTETFIGGFNIPENYYDYKIEMHIWDSVSNMNLLYSNIFQ